MKKRYDLTLVEAVDAAMLEVAARYPVLLSASEAWVALPQVVKTELEHALARRLGASSHHDPICPSCADRET